MKGAAYEAFVNTLVNQLILNTSFAKCQVQSGATNRIVGASGYPHQIDVSISCPSLNCLIETKHWSKPVGVEAILVLASRATDIQAKTPGVKTHASIVSTQRATRGAAKLATHFGISIDLVSSLEEYVLQLSNQIFAGVCSTGIIGSSAEAEVVMRKAASPNPINLNIATEIVASGPALGKPGAQAPECTQST